MLEVNETPKAELVDAASGVFVSLQKLGELVGREKNPVVVRNAIHQLGLAMEKLPQCEQILDHIYADGLYGRKWSCEAGNIIVTEIHRVEHISSLVKGKIVIANEDGCQVLEAPQFFVTKPGTQRVLLTLEDCVFTTVHRNDDNEKDPDVLKKRLTARTYDELEGAL